nr:large extracellular alpha-helical protein [Gammaproteobacteria bacterium]NIV77032.1 large extracellular alpha-helical protein [Gammaproteobacteria bacterium]
MLRRPLILLAACLWAGAAHPAFDSAQSEHGEEIRVQRITPSGVDVPAGRQIVIQFNRPMVPVGRMERRRDEVPITVEPEPGCEWRWLNTSALACQLGADAALNPATGYTVTVSEAFRAEDGARLGEAFVHRFVTQRPKLERAYFRTWQAPGMPVMRVQFNLPVTRESVEASLHLVPGDGAPVGVRTGEITPAREAEGVTALPLPGEAVFIIGRPLAAPAEAGEARRYWELLPARELPLDSRVLLRVSPGLATPKGPLRGVERRRALRFHTFPEFRFIGVRCRSNESDVVEVSVDAAGPHPPCNPVKSVYLAFSAPVLSPEIRDHVRFEPDLAGGREDYDPWENRHNRSALHRAHERGRHYFVRLPEMLRARQAYRVELGAEVRDEFGRPLPSPVSLAFRTDARPPALKLLYSHAVVESQVENDVPVVVTNLDELRVRYSGTTAAGDVPRATAPLPLAPVQDKAYYVPLGLKERLGAPSGALFGRLEPTPTLGHRRFLFFAQATPFQVHAKLGHYNTLVWVTDLATGAPVADAEVGIHLGRYARLDSMPAPSAQGVTDADGVALLPGRKALDPGLDHRYVWRWDAPRLFVRVERGGDMALLPLDQHFDVRNHSVRAAYEERYGHVKSWGTTAQGVYRAGDTIQFKFYVRDEGNRTLERAPPGPYHLKVIDPAGKLAYEEKDLALNAFGAASGEFVVPETGAVGWYRFELDADFLEFTLRPLRVLVADFTPSPFKVSTVLNGDLFHSGDAVTVDTRARMHAGGPYADAKTRITARLRERSLRPEASWLKAFVFDTLQGKRSPETVSQTEGRVDGEGQLRSGFVVASEEIVYGRLEVESAVSDDRGKYVSGFADARYAGRDRYVGVRRAGWLLEAGEASRVDVAVVDAGGAPVAGTEVAVVVEHQKVTAARVRGAGNAYVTRYNREWVQVARCRVASALEPVACEFTPSDPGRHRITARITDTLGRVHATDVRQWAVGRGRVLWDDQSDKRLDILPEAERYGVGDTARYLVKNPYPGARALVTVERNGVIEHRVQHLEGSTPVIELPIEPDLVPGFYLSVVVLSPRQEPPSGEAGVDLGRPTYRIGYVETEVRDRHKEIVASARVESEEYRPGDTVRVDLRAHPREGADDPPIELAVAVLDEAVFDMIQGGRKYFDPYQGFYALDRLDVENFSLLTRLLGLQDFEKKGANPGGGGGASVEARRIDRYVAYWEPSVPVDARGRARVAFTAPDNLTGWRVLVLAATAGDRFGLGEGRFRVNKPTEVRPVMPNQVLEGDRFTAGFSVMNRTDRARELNLEWRVEGPVAGPRVAEQTLALAPFKRDTVNLPVRTQDAGVLAITLIAGDAHDRDALVHEVPVRQRQAPVTAATYGTSTRATVREQVRYPAPILPDVGGLSVVLSPSIIGNLAGAFAHLRDYPYLSWETRLTKAVMASHYENLHDYLEPGLEWPGSGELPATTLRQAASFQAPNGGMAYFTPRDDYVSPYLSAYTALAFDWLRESGHAVPEAVEGRLHGYLRTLLRRDVLPGFYSRGMASTVRAVALAALAARGEVGREDLE